MLESAAYFISGINAEHLHMPEKLFQDYFSGAVPHHKPLSRGKFVSKYPKISTISKNILSTANLDLFCSKEKAQSFKPTFVDRDADTITADEIKLLLAEYKIMANR